MSFHLRPVSDNSPSPNSVSSITPPSDRSPPFSKPPTTSRTVSPPPPSSSRPRRRLSPSSIRDVDLSHTSEMPARKYPPPPTGHELMAMFPPPPPSESPEMRPGPTSGFFQRQEKAFFAKAGKEIVRVQLDIDLTQDGMDTDSVHSKHRGRDFSGVRNWSTHSSINTHAHNSSNQSTHSSTSSQLLQPLPVPASVPPPPPSAPNASPAPVPMHYQHPGPPRPQAPPTRTGPVPVTPYSVSTRSPPAQIPPNLHPQSIHQPGLGMRSPPQDPIPAGSSVPKTEYPSEGYNVDLDDSWRTPIPYNERRRAGKHTRRVIVR
ncbi:hypothetical protein AX16_001576 [Volvariella volvacea WC 439]|nr:hypothetical protein AX16_001576 [Volvariella volvacea WC 439]